MGDWPFGCGWVGAGYQAWSLLTPVDGVGVEATVADPFCRGAFVPAWAVPAVPAASSNDVMTRTVGLDPRRRRRLWRVIMPVYS